MITELEYTYPAEIERYRQLLLRELGSMEQAASERLRTLYSRAMIRPEDVRFIHHELLARQQPLLDELARIYEIHAQPNLVIAS